MEWWVYRDGEVSNRPLSKYELREKEYIREDTYVCRTGRDSWVRAADDPELKHIFDSEDVYGDAEDLELDDDEGGARATPAFNVDHTPSEPDQDDSAEAGEPESTEDTSDTDGTSFRSQSDIIATSIWERPLAFCVDFGLFYGIAWVLSHYYYQKIVEFHTSGIVIGHSAFLLYLTFFNSEFGGSATIGKKLFGIKVKDEAGFSLSFFTSFWRYFLLMLPVVLWSVVFTELLGPLPDVVHVALSMIAIFFLIAILYLFLFNTYRRSLHDCITSTVVVREKPQDVLNFSFNRAHLYSLGILFALCIYGLSIAFSHFGGVVPILSLQKSILEDRTVLATGVPVYRNLWNRGTDDPTTLYVRVWVDEEPRDPGELKRRIVRKAFDQSIMVKNYRRINIGIGTGVDFGIFREIDYRIEEKPISVWRAYLRDRS